MNVSLAAIRAAARRAAHNNRRSLCAVANELAVPYCVVHKYVNGVRGFKQELLSILSVVPPDAHRRPSYEEAYQLLEARGIRVTLARLCLLTGKSNKSVRQWVSRHYRAEASIVNAHTHRRLKLVARLAWLKKFEPHRSRASIASMAGIPPSYITVLMRRNPELRTVFSV